MEETVTKAWAHENRADGKDEWIIDNHPLHGRVRHEAMLSLPQDITRVLILQQGEWMAILSLQGMRVRSGTLSVSTYQGQEKEVAQSLLHQQPRQDPCAVQEELRKEQRAIAFILQRKKEATRIQESGIGVSEEVEKATGNYRPAIRTKRKAPQDDLDKASHKRRKEKALYAYLIGVFYCGFQATHRIALGVGHDMGELWEAMANRPHQTSCVFRSKE
jgi:hypothetical protein